MVMYCESSLRALLLEIPADPFRPSMQWSRASSCVPHSSPTLESLADPNLSILQSSVAVLAVISFSTPFFLFAAVVIILMYWVIGAAYLALSRQLKRIESVSRSPIYVCFAEVVSRQFLGLLLSLLFLPPPLQF